MAAIIGAELSVDRLISADPTNGVLAALDTAGAVVNLLAWSPLTGDATYSAPVGTGTNTRRHMFDRPIVSTSTAQFAGSVITDAATAARRGFLINISGAYVAGIDADAATGEVRIGGMSVADYFPLFFSDGVERARIGIGGQFLVGTTVTTSAAAGDVVLKNTGSLRGVNAAGTDTKKLIELTSGDGVEVGAGQIAFPAAQNASSGANVLDDYEEGTWTPVDSSGAALTFTGASGTYEKIGRLVIARGVCTYPATAEGSAAIIGGLPFSTANVESSRQGFVSMKTESTLFSMAPSKNATTINLLSNVLTAISNAAMSGDLIYFTVIYQVA